MGLEIGPAPERSRSWTSWTSYISYEARWPRVSTHARNVLKCGPNDVSGAWNVAYVITGSHQRNAMSWARPGSAGGALGRPWGPWGGGVMQSVCSRKPPYKIHEDLRDSSGKEKLSVAMVESTGCLRYFEWDRSETIFGNFSSRPTQIQRDQEKFRHEGGEQEGRAMAPYRTPFAPPSSSGTPTASQSWSLWFWTALTIWGWYMKEERL